MALIRANKVSVAGDTCTLKTSGPSTSASISLSSLTKGAKYLLVMVSTAQSTNAAATNAVTVSSASNGSYEAVESPTYSSYSSSRFGHSGYLLTPSSTSMTITRAASTYVTYMLYKID